MSTPARSPARLCLLALCVAWVGADAEEKTSDPVIGGVYVARQLSEDSSRTERASVWPLAALRVDDRRSDTLLVKYTVAPEPLANADFRYESACDCFKSKEDLAFGVFSGWRREFKIEYEEVFLKFKPGELDLWYFEDGEMRGPYCLPDDIRRHGEPVHAQAPVLRGNRFLAYSLMSLGTRPARRGRLRKLSGVAGSRPPMPTMPHRRCRQAGPALRMARASAIAPTARRWWRSRRAGSGWVASGNGPFPNTSSLLMK